MTAHTSEILPPHDEEHDHVHEAGPLAELVTVRDWIRHAVSRFNRGHVFFGHGCSDAFDEAVWLILGSLDLPLDRLEPFLDACILAEERVQLLEQIEKRVEDRVPTAYLLQEAWLGEYRFHVDERVIIPRSFLAEWLNQGVQDWLEQPDALGSALDLCTGSGCLAVLLADAFPAACIIAADLSEAALEVAQINVAEYGLEDRVELVHSDVFSALADRRFDLIISNPPYVTEASMNVLPPEYLHEPRIALAAGEDGLDVVRRLLADARRHLNPGGVLAVEVGHNRAIVEHAFPELELNWVSSATGDMVFVLRREDLPE